MKAPPLSIDPPPVVHAAAAQQLQQPTALSQDAVPVPPGTLLGERFEVMDIVARGGMGTVVRALDRQSSRVVALKLLREDALSFRDAERFHRETRVLADLRHPNIVSYIAHGTTPTGQPFLAMEWLRGEDLSRRLRRGRLGTREAVRTVRAVAGALAFAHQRGIVHRDVKPSNVFLCEEGGEGVKLLDFGIARAQDPSTRLTQTGSVIGTLDYMSPEQAAGKSDVGFPTDVFSLGCVLFECLTGQPPFPGVHAAAVLAKIFFADAPSVRATYPSIPEWLDALIARMLAKDPSARPADADAIVLELPDPDAIVENDEAAVVRQSVDRSLANVELQLVSVVVASASATASTLTPEAAALQNEGRQLLRNRLARLGAHATWLADGSLVATLSNAANAKDQVVQAARCALALREHWAEADVGVATGRGVVHHAVPVGEAIDRAVELVRGPARGTTGSGVLLDRVSAGLLDERFSVERTESGIFLRGEHLLTDQEEARQLLGKPTPFVGREQELLALQAAVHASVEESVARAVLVTAPPGLGKSRLRHELLRRLARPQDGGAPPQVFLGRGDAGSAGSPYDLLSKALRAASGARIADAPAAQLEGLRARVSASVADADVERVTEFLGELCAMLHEEDASQSLRAARRDPRIMSDQVGQAFVDFLRAECRRGGVLLVLEDLHWGDALTVKLVDQALRELRDEPLTVLAFARPEVSELFPRLWPSRIQEVRLPGLGKRACEKLVVDVLGEAAGEKTVARIVQQAAGNALYLEELIRAAADGKGDDTPDTVLAMLQSRLERLDPGARRLLRAASVFGGVFSRGGVLALSAYGGPADEADALLRLLVETEVLERRRDRRYPDNDDYVFRHGLVRDAAYSLLTEEDKSLGHRLAGIYLEDIGEPDPMVVADHHQRGGALERAVPWYARAAAAALAGNDLAGALARSERGVACGARGELLGVLRGLACDAYFWRDEWTPGYFAAKEALALLPAGGERWCRTVAHQFVFTTLGLQKHAEFGELVQMFAATPPTPDAREAYVEAAAWLVTMFCIMGQRDSAAAFLGILDGVGAGIGDRHAEAWRAQAHMFNGRMLGDDPWATLHAATQSAEAFQSVGDQRNYAFVEGYRGLAQADLGMLQEGEATLRASLALAHELEEVLMATNATLYLALVLARQDGRRREAFALATEILGRNPLADGVAHGIRAEAELHDGELALAEDLASKAQEMLAAMPTLRLHPLAVGIGVALTAGRSDDASVAASEGLALLEKSGGGYNEVLFRVAAAEAYEGSGSRERALTTLRDALDHMKRRAAKIPEDAARERFQRDVPENARALSLWRSWGASLGPSDAS